MLLLHQYPLQYHHNYELQGGTQVHRGASSVERSRLVLHEAPSALKSDL